MFLDYESEIKIFIALLYITVTVLVLINYVHFAFAVWQRVLVMNILMLCEVFVWSVKFKNSEISLKNLRLRCIIVSGNQQSACQDTEG